MKNSILIRCMFLSCAWILVARAQNPPTGSAATPLARERPAAVSPANAKPAQVAASQNAEAGENLSLIHI